MEIKHKNQTYTLDVERALELGFLKKQITKIEPGDVYEYEGGTRVCFIKACYWSSNFRIIRYNGLTHYSDSRFSKPEGATPQETIDWVNKVGLKFIRNINEDMEKLIKD